MLDGAFTVLEALARADEGLGLTALAARTDLAKSTAYRLAEQLVAKDAVQRVGRRYFVGPTIARLGRSWQPDPLLWKVSHEPVRTLSVLTRATAAVYVLRTHRGRLVCAAAPVGQSWIPPGEFDTGALPHTAVGKVLLATKPRGKSPSAMPAESRWRVQEPRLHDERFVITDSDRVPGGSGCAAVPIWGPDGRCVGVAAVFVRAPTVPKGVTDLLIHTARRIGHALRSGVTGAGSVNRGVPAVRKGTANQ